MDRISPHSGGLAVVVLAARGSAAAALYRALEPLSTALERRSGVRPP
jgi:hypothetical protein